MSWTPLRAGNVFGDLSPTVLESPPGEMTIKLRAIVFRPQHKGGLSGVCDYRILDEICSLMLLHRAREFLCNGRILPTHAGSHLEESVPSPLEKLSMSPVEPAAPPRELRDQVVDDNQDAADALARVLSIWGQQCR